jgi:hypothetical protein
LDEGDAHLATIARRMTRTEVYKHPYAVIVIAPARFRSALWAAIGETNGEVYFQAVMTSDVVRVAQLRVLSQAKTTKNL